jgi:hypothetical protein
MNRVFLTGVGRFPRRDGSRRLKTEIRNRSEFTSKEKHHAV